MSPVATTDRPVVGSAEASADPRIVARRDEVRSTAARRVRRIVGAFAVVIGLAGVGWLALLSPALDIDRVQILGAADVDEARVVAATGVRVGQATYSVDPEAVAARLERLPEVDRADVRVRWPSSLEVRLTTRTPIARLLGVDEAVMTVSAGGVVLDEAAILPEDVIEVRVADLEKLRPGGTLPTSLARSIDVVGRLPIPVAWRVGGAAIDRDGSITLELVDGGVIRFGGADDADQKLLAIEAMLSGRVDIDGLCRLDVRIAAAPKIVRNPWCDPPAPVAPAPDPAITPDPASAAGAAAQPADGGPGAPEPEVVAPDQSEVPSGQSSPVVTAGFVPPG